MKRFKKIVDLKNYKRKVLAVLTAAGLSFSMTGCGETNKLDYLDYIESTNEVSSGEVINNLLENEDLSIRTKYEYNDSKLCKLGEIAVLKVGNFNKDNELEIGFIDPFTGAELVKLGCESIYSSYINNESVLNVTYSDGTKETLKAATLENVLNEKVESTLEPTIEPTVTPESTLEPTIAPAATPEVTKEPVKVDKKAQLNLITNENAKKRSEQIQKSADPIAEMYSI